MICVCGHKLEGVKQNVTTKYKGKSIRILDVPCFICKNDHLKMSRETRKRLRFDLKDCYETGLGEKHFGA